MINAMTADYHAQETIVLYTEQKRIIKTAELKTKEYHSDLMKNYFSRCEFLLDTHGILLASAKLESYTNFRTEDFKKDHPDLYEKYSNNGTRQRLIIK